MIIDIHTHLVGFIQDYAGDKLREDLARIGVQDLWNHGEDVYLAGTNWGSRAKNL